MPRIVRDQHPLFAHEQLATSPLQGPSVATSQVPEDLHPFRGIRSVVPGQCHGRKLASFGILIFAGQPRRRTDRIDGRSTSGYSDGISEVECPVGKIHVVTTKVSETAVS